MNSKSQPTVTDSNQHVIQFTKMEGLGNDFVVLDDLGPSPATSESITAEVARKICDRRFGIGADQILWLRKPQDSSLHVRMEIFNSDGSTAEMCGNGIRAVGVYMDHHHPVATREFRVETLAGVQVVHVGDDAVSVDMGHARLGVGFETGGERIELLGKEYRFFEVNVGNPHAVFFVENVSEFPVEELGPLVERHPRFPHRTNVEFVEVESAQSIRVRVWERGAGITLACGTGACAAAVASLATERVHGQLDVHLPGGVLKINWKQSDSTVTMEGPAREVFQGTFEL